MISDRHKCIFVHIPRCAGTSVESVLWPGERGEAELWMGFVDRHHNRYQTGGLQHLLARQIREAVGARRFDSYFKFAVVRNPFDRTVSQFAYMQLRPDLRSFVELGTGASFGEYLEAIQRRRHVQWEPQCSFIHGESGELLVDCLVRFESLERELRPLLARFGVYCREVPHENLADRTSYSDYYSDESRALVEDLYRSDIDRLGYEF
jgi:Sulfotransferase family